MCYFLATEKLFLFSSYTEVFFVAAKDFRRTYLAISFIIPPSKSGSLKETTGLSVAA